MTASKGQVASYLIKRVAATTTGESAEQQAREYLEWLRWPHGAVCPHCLKKSQSNGVKGREGQHRCRSCRSFFTVRIGTIFERSHVPLHKWLHALFLIHESHGRVVANLLSQEIHVSYKSAWYMIDRIKQACKDRGMNLFEIHKAGRLRAAKHPSQPFKHQTILVSVNTAPVIELKNSAGQTIVQTVNVKRKILTSFAMFSKSQTDANAAGGPFIFFDNNPCEPRVVMRAASAEHNGATPKLNGLQLSNPIERLTYAATVDSINLLKLLLEVPTSAKALQQPSKLSSVDRDSSFPKRNETEPNVKYTADIIRKIVREWLSGRISNMGLGLPEFDDRLGLWRTSLTSLHNGKSTVGEVRVSRGKVVYATSIDLIKRRLKNSAAVRKKAAKKTIAFAPIPSRLILGDAAKVLEEHPPDSAQLVFTSPPYFNAKPEYYESETYEKYLEMLNRVFSACHDVLSEGRFLAVNTSPVLVRRAHRGAASRRIPITFDLHRILDRMGFEFIDEIIWQKPEGAGWSLGRGRRFAADRQPLQYKPVVVTESIVIYRKRTDKLIDWNLRFHPDQDALHKSLIKDGYERTNIWSICPSHHSKHPATFPERLAEKIVRYYSLKGDMVLDPFSGTGTSGRVAGRLGRRFMMIENAPDYFALQTADFELLGFNPQIINWQFYGSALAS